MSRIYWRIEIDRSTLVPKRGRQQLDLAKFDFSQFVGSYRLLATRNELSRRRGSDSVENGFDMTNCSRRGIDDRDSGLKRPCEFDIETYVFSSACTHRKPAPEAFEGYDPPTPVGRTESDRIGDVRRERRFAKERPIRDEGLRVEQRDSATQ